MNKVIRLLSLCLAMTMLISSAYAAEQIAYPFTSATESQRFTTLTNEIRCPVCQGQSIADSNAPLAKDLRNKVYQLIQENQSDAEIRSYLTKRYGDVILFRPPLKQSTWLLWSFPFVLLSFIPLFLLSKKRKSKTGL